MEEENPATDNLCIAGIGVSTGALGALKRLLGNIPPDTGLAYVIVMHLSPEHKSSMAEILQHSSKMPVMQVDVDMPVQADHIYIIPPNANLNSVDTHLRLSQLEEKRSRRAPIDHFFRTLARTHDGDALGIILTGEGMDGTLGLKEIRSRGGLTIVQDPSEADANSMPHAAISTGLADAVLSLDKMVDFFLNFVQWKPCLDILDEEGQLLTEAKNTYQQLMNFLKLRLGHDYQRYEPGLIVKRLQRRMKLQQKKGLEDYLDFIMTQMEEANALSDEIQQTLSSFFHPPEVFKKLEEQIIPRVLQAKEEEEPLRFWIIGCDTGELAYSLGMLLQEICQNRYQGDRIQVFASELHERSLVRARKGFFPGNIHLDVNGERLSRFFTHELHGYLVRPHLRENMIFSRHDILSDPPFSHIDMIICQGILQKLNRQSREAVLQRLHYSLKHGGLLLHDQPETDFTSEYFEQVDDALKLFQNIKKHGNKIDHSDYPQYSHYQDHHHQEKSSERHLRLLHESLIQEFVPPSLMVDENYQVLMVRDGGGRYLQISGGEPTSNLWGLLLPDLRADVRIAMDEAVDKREVSTTPVLHVMLEGEEQSLRVRVRYLENKMDGQLYFLAFEENLMHPVMRPQLIASDTPGEEQQGEQVKLMKQRMNYLMERYEESQQHLRKSYDELLSKNNDLLEAVRQLEAGKQELRSSNEELRILDQENRQHLAKLHRLSDDLKNLLEAVDIAVIFLDKEMCIQRFTPRSQEIFMLRELDIGRPLSDQVHTLDYPTLIADARQVFRSLQSTEKEVKDHHGRTFLARILAYRGEEHQIGGVVLSFIDISSQKSRDEMEQEMRNTAESARIKDEFLATVSHEIRTPLNAISGITNLLIRSQPRPEQIRLLNTLLFSTRSLLTLVNDILDFSKLQAGKVELESIPYRLSSLLESLMHAHGPLAEEKNIRLHYQLDERLPQVLHGDPHKLVQVLNNLLSNAIKFTEEGEVHLEIRQEKREKDKVLIYFAVRDNGIGISERKQRQIFEKFSQADSSTERRFGGTGLGLSITKELLQLMDSNLSLKSREGKGSTFSFQIQQPIGREDEITEETPQPEKPEVGENVMQHAHILLVEDAAVNRMVVQQYLQEWWQIEADEAEDGLQATEMAARKNYDIILMDIRMPKLNGVEASRKIRGINPHNARLPIVALTADINSLNKKDRHESLFNAVVSKPFEPNILMSTISGLISDEDRPDATQQSVSVRDKLMPDLESAEEPFEGMPEKKKRFYQMAIRSLEQFRVNLNEHFKSHNVEQLKEIMHKEKLLINMLKLEDFYEDISQLRNKLEQGATYEDLSLQLSEIDQGLEVIIARLHEHEAAIV